MGDLCVKKEGDVLKYDKSLVAAVIGILSTVPYQLLTWVLVSYGIGKYSVYQLTSLIVTINRPIAILGGVISSVVGGTIGMLFYLGLQKIGRDYLVIKSVMASLLAWVIMETIYTWLLEGPKLIQPRPISDYYIQMFGSFLFGATMGLLFKKYLVTK